MEDKLKVAAARAALRYVAPKGVIGLGSGSTARIFVQEFAREFREREGYECICTSSATEAVAREAGLPIGDPEKFVCLDITVDGADEVAHDLSMIKGGGGAMMREKIAAHASRDHITIIDESKFLELLGNFPLPVEIPIYGRTHATSNTEAAMKEFGCSVEWSRIRKTEDGEDYVTDNGNHILDVKLEQIIDPVGLSHTLDRTLGVISHGIFCNLTKRLIIAKQDGSIQEKTLP